jgi:alpha-beta hydrolase superfamily lysophospholipase
MSPAAATEFYTGEEQIRIFYRSATVEGERARLVIAHGLGEHSGRYERLMERLNRSGISVWAPDHRGFGRSGGKRGHVRGFDQYLKDLDRMVEIARRGLPEQKKLFLLGHSMGGLMALRYGQEKGDRIDGLIVSSPALAPARPIPAARAIPAKILSRLHPSLTINNEIDSRLLSHDTEVVQAYDNDPLVHRRVTPRWFTAFLGAMEEAKKGAPRMQTPLLLQVAGEDSLVAPEASRRFFESLSLRDKTLHVYEGLYHEIYNEAEEDRERVLTDLEQWISDHF